MHRRDIHAKEQANSEHAFTADHSHFQTGVAIDRSHQGDVAIGGKVNVPDTVARQAQNIREDQVDGLAVRQHMLEVLVRQGGEQTVCRGTVVCGVHRRLLW